MKERTLRGMSVSMDEWELIAAVLDAAEAEVTAKDAAIARRCAEGTGDAWTAAEDAREAAVRALREAQS